MGLGMMLKVSPFIYNLLVCHIYVPLCERYNHATNIFVVSLLDHEWYFLSNNSDRICLAAHGVIDHDMQQRTVG